MTTMTTMTTMTAEQINALSDAELSRAMAVAHGWTVKKTPVATYRNANPQEKMGLHNVADAGVHVQWGLFLPNGSLWSGDHETEANAWTEVPAVGQNPLAAFALVQSLPYGSLICTNGVWRIAFDLSEQGDRRIARNGGPVGSGKTFAEAVCRAYLLAYYLPKTQTTEVAAQ